MNAILESYQADLGPFAPAVVERVASLAEMQAGRRMAGHDPALWAADPAGQAEIRKHLGWLEAPARSRSLLAEVGRLVKELQAAGFTHALLLGAGGAGLAAEAAAGIFGPREVNGRSGLEIQVLDSTNPAQVRAAVRWSAVENTLYLVSSLDGSDSGVNASLNYFWARARRRLGDRAGAHFVAITRPNSALEKLARERKFRRVFLEDVSISAPYSVLSAAGLVPLGLLGVNLDQFLASAAALAAQCGPETAADRSPGLVLAALLAEAALQGREKLTLLADAPLAPFGAWLEQLLASSTGKLGRGLLPVDREPALQPRQYGSDRLFVYLRLDGSEAGRVHELRAAGQPVLTLPMTSPEELGAAYYQWQYATALACAVLGINPFDAPDAGDTKLRLQAKLALYPSTRGLEEGQPVWEGAGGRVYGWDFPGLNGARTLADVVRTFANQARGSDYLAIQAYLPGSPQVIGSLQQLRARLSKHTHCATTLGFGARYLAATGQLHKGGPNTDLFLQITQDSTSDVEIPGEGYSFGVLERAQALSDLEALLARGRRVIRVHLVDGSLKDLLFK